MNRVKEYRKKQQLSQFALAQKIGVARQTINLIENDKYNPSLDLCRKLALALRTDLNSLFREESEWLKKNYVTACWNYPTELAANWMSKYQRQRLDHLGNSGYLLLTLFTPLLLVAMVLALTTTYKIAFLFAFISILTLFIVVTWYFYLVMGKERVLINELPTKELKKTKRWVVKRGIIIGLVAAGAGYTGGT